jgi:hypothetical protein
MKYLVFIYIFIIITLISCDKEYQNIYYFKCKINGEAFTPNDCTNCEKVEIIGDTLLLLSFVRNIKSMGILVFSNPIAIKTYYLGLGGHGLNSAQYTDVLFPGRNAYNTDSIYTGLLTITELDKVNKIISGKFSFNAHNPIMNKSIIVSNGEFRQKYE